MLLLSPLFYWLWEWHFLQRVLGGFFRFLLLGYSVTYGLNVSTWDFYFSFLQYIQSILSRLLVYQYRFWAKHISLQQGKISEAEKSIKTLNGKERVAEVMNDLREGLQGSSEQEAGWFDLFSGRYWKGITEKCVSFLLLHAVQVILTSHQIVLCCLYLWDVIYVVSILSSYIWYLHLELISVVLVHTWRFNSLASCCYTCSHAFWCNYVESRFLWHMHLAAVVSVGAALFLFQQLAGINAVVYYSTSVFRSAGIASDVAASALVGASNVFGNPFYSLWFLVKFWFHTL